MCTRKRNITLPALKDFKNLWKMPTQLTAIYMNNGQPTMLAKCGKCYECKKEKARNWTYKIWLEALSHKNKCFITLTYKDNTKGNNLNKKELQNFIKRLRKNQKANFKYFASGEYGEKKGRAHYHIIILGWQPPDTKKMHGALSNKGKELYTSKIVRDTWGNGRITIQPFAKNEVGYLTLYLNHNEELEKNINETELKRKNNITLHLKLKYGILEKRTDHKGQIRYTKLCNLKDIERSRYNEYKKEYRKKMEVIKLNKQPEFNISSKNIGFKNFIDKEYYKYDLIIDEMTYEKPKEYLRKVLENPSKYNDEIIENIQLETLKRKEYAEENHVNYEDKEERAKMRMEETTQIENNENMKKLYKHVESPF